MPGRSICSGLVALFAVLAAGMARAQEPAEDVEAPLSGPPVAVLNVAGVDRLLDDVDYLFGSIERSDMKEVIDGLLGNLGDLRGLDRTKSFGAMVFLKPGIVPQPAVVAYVPVVDAASLARTIEMGPVTTKKTADDRYEIIGRRQTFFARMMGSYAFVTNDEELLDRELPEPTEAFAALTTRYDVGIEVLPENVPPGMRDLFLNIVRTQTQAQLQQRDDEPDTAYAFRKMQGTNNLRMVEAFLKETRSIRLGLDASRETRKAVLELIIEAVPDTPYLETLQSLAEDPSRFAPLLGDDVPLSFSINSKLDDHSKKTNGELLDFGSKQLAVALTKLEQGDDLGAAPAEAAPEPDIETDPVTAALADRLFAPLKATVEGGNLDVFAQFLGDPEKKFVAIAGVEIPGAREMETPFRELFDRIRTARPEFADRVEVQYGAAEAAGVSLHRVAGREVREAERRLYGDDFAVYIGFAQDAIWLAAGGGQAVETLDTAIGRVNQAGLAERNRAAAPFQIVATANRWIGLDPNAENLELVQDAFSDGDDTLRIDFRPTEKGGRLRIELEEGFIRLLGLGVSKRYDESQL